MVGIGVDAVMTAAHTVSTTTVPHSDIVLRRHGAGESAGRTHRAHAAHKALLRAWALGGVAAADQVMLDVAMPLFSTPGRRGRFRVGGAGLQRRCAPTRIRLPGQIEP